MGELMPEVQAPSDADAALLWRLMRERFDPLDAAGEYAAMHERWFWMILQYAGDQRFAVDGLKGTVGVRADGAAPTWRSTYAANLIYPKVQRLVSTLAGRGTAGRAAPAGTGYEDVVRARNSEKFLDHVRYVSGFERERALAILYAAIVGTGLIKLWFDPMKGEQRAVRNAGGEELRRIRIGEAQARAALPFGLRVPVYCDRDDDLPWAAYTTFRDRDMMRARYPHAAERIQAVDVSGALDWRAEARLRKTRSGGVVGPDDSKDRVVRHTEFFLAPTYGYPRGAYCVAINDVVVHVGRKGDELSNPFAEIGDPIPFMAYRYGIQPGSFWGMSLTEMLESPQAEYNRTRRDIVENLRLTGRPKWLSPKGGLVARNALTSAPGEVVEYNASAGKPEPVAPPPLPAYVSEHTATCAGEMKEIAGQPEVAEGRAPASVRSGVAIEMLQTAAQETVALARIEIANADQEAYRRMLRIVAACYVEERQIAVLGADKKFEVLRLSGQDLGAPESVRVFAEAGVFESKAARRQNILDATQLGVFATDDPIARMELAAAIEMGDVAPHLAEMLVDQRRADEENGSFEELASTGKLPDVPQARDFEDHVVHIRRHNLFRKSERYRLMKPEAQKIVDGHVEIHQSFLQAQVLAQQEAKAKTAGTPGDKGKPSPEGSGKSGQAAPKDNGPGDDK